VTWFQAILFAAIVLIVVSMPGCASTQSQLQESRVQLKAVNPSALRARPEYQHRIEQTCDGHGGVGLVRKVEYQCNDGLSGHLEVRE
jgi:hypothetical protein